MHDFIKARPYLIWYVNDYDKLDAPAIVEATLNYGDWEDVQKLIGILGLEEVSRIFREYSSRTRSNYDSKISHFFNLYFAAHA